MVEDAMPGTVIDIARRTGLSKTTIHDWINRFRDEGDSHIAKWERSLEGGGGGFKPYHVRGPGKDAPQPARLTLAETARRHRAKLEKEGRLDTHRAKMRARHTVKLAAAGKLTDPLIAALFASRTKPQQENA